ncbi:hypothetical protein FQN50_007651 [Emmonsiellopsis sp. PD_5]|nr:hypothetical protein FQN50_007651 [Emmonsiellopsis sp. PD_5]
MSASGQPGPSDTSLRSSMVCPTLPPMEKKKRMALKKVTPSLEMPSEDDEDYTSSNESPTTPSQPAVNDPVTI